MAVELNVRTQLMTIVKELEQIASASGKVGADLSKGMDQVGEGLEDQVNKTSRYLTSLRSLGGRVASQLVRDFKALGSVNALMGSVKMSNVFGGAVKEAFTVNDAVRKFSQTLGIADSARARFQSNLVSGLGQIGISADSAARSIEGLAKTSVRGEGNLIGYARTGGMLASLGNEQGREGEITKGLADLLTARGENPNSMLGMSRQAQDIRRIQLSTGRGASQILQSLNDLFSGANQDFQKRLKNGGAGTLANAALLGGPEATAFIERYLKSNRYERASLNAMGLGNLLTDKGELNRAGISSVVRQARAFGMGDAAAGFQVMNIPAEQAQGLIRLEKSFTEQAEAYRRFSDLRARPVSLQSQFEAGRGFGEAARGVLSSALSLASPVTSRASELGARGMNALAKSPLASAGAVAGAGVLTAVMGSLGLKGVGSALGIGGLAKGAAIEAATGRKVQPVYVVNADEIRNGGILSAAGGALGVSSTGGILGGAVPGAASAAAAGAIPSAVGAGVLGAAGAGVAAAGTLVFGAAEATNRLVNPGQGSITAAFVEALKELLSGKTLRDSPEFTRRADQHVRISVEAKSKDFRTVNESQRGVNW